MTMLTYGTPQEAGMDAGRIEKLRARAPQWIDPERMRCAVLLAARRGRIAYHEAYGTLTWEQDSPITEKDAIFRVASITKPITATLAMMLVEDGLLGLNRPIKEYLPEICGQGTDDVEVQHLFTHTSGFDEEDAEVRYEKALQSKTATSGGIRSVASYLPATWDLPSQHAPGSKMDYADHNFELVGEIVRRVSGMTLEGFARARLFDPLGMCDTSYERDTTKLERIARRREGLVLPEGVWGADGLNITALDLAKFGQMFLDTGLGPSGRILSPASVREMTRNQIPGIKTEFLGVHEEASWGLGWTIQDNERWRWCVGSLTPKGTFYHMGAGGYQIWIDPVNEIVGVYLSVCLDIDQETMEHHWNLDLFQNMVTAAVMD